MTHLDKQKYNLRDERTASEEEIRSLIESIPIRRVKSLVLYDPDKRINGVFPAVLVSPSPRQTRRVVDLATSTIKNMNISFSEVTYVNGGPCIGHILSTNLPFSNMCDPNDGVRGRTAFLPILNLVSGRQWQTTFIHYYSLRGCVEGVGKRIRKSYLDRWLT